MNIICILIVLTIIYRREKMSPGLVFKIYFTRNWRKICIGIIIEDPKNNRFRRLSEMIYIVLR